MTLALADWSALAPCSRQPTAELSSLVREGVGSQLALQPEQTMSSEVLRPTRLRTWNGFAPPASRTSIAEACEEAACRRGVRGGGMPWRDGSARSSKTRRAL